MKRQQIVVLPVPFAEVHVDTGVIHHRNERSGGDQMSEETIILTKH
jgi:hypothetical protein